MSISRRSTPSTVMIGLNSGLCRPHREIDDGGLAGAGWALQDGDLARRDVESDVADDRRVAMGEAYFFEAAA